VPDDIQVLLPDDSASAKINHDHKKKVEATRANQHVIKTAAGVPIS
jgi:hypothetical protein